jgi:hypothetical protein
MKPFATFDIETDPFKYGRHVKPFACDFFDGKRHQLFWGKDCVARCFAVMRCFNGYIYAHNGGKFDFQFLLPLLPVNDCKVSMIRSRISKIAFAKVEFRDSYLMLPIPLKTYGKTPIDYRKMESDVREQHKAEICRYLKDDCESLYEMVREFSEEYGFGLTLAGRTFAQLKKRFDIVPPKCDVFFDRKFRRYYYGGRVEFFELGRLRGAFKICDINSAYPFAMKSRHAFGRAFLSVNTLPTKPSILETCFVSFVGESAGGIPWHEADGSLSFKPHRGEFHCTGWELVAARDLGLVKVQKVLRCHRPLELRHFSEFVDYFYGMKKKAEKGSPEEIFAKLILNSCYGRFATRADLFTETKITEYGDEPEENIEAKKKGEDPPWTLTNDFEDVGISIWETPTPLRPDSFYNVATAASITGAVRAQLMRSLAACQRPVYCDTDCIIAENCDALKISPELGDWKLEGETEKDGLWIAGKKLYAAKLKTGKWKCAAKGVRIPPEQICRIALGEVVKSNFDAPSFSLKSGTKFVSRTVRRDDQRKRRKSVDG